MGTISRSRRRKAQSLASLYHRANKGVLALLLACLWAGCQLVFSPEISGFLRASPGCFDHDPPKKDVCFVTCIFGNSVEEVDTPANVEWFQRQWCSSARFDLVTNLRGLPAPGWTQHVVSRDHDKGGFPHIVQSREAKFLAWRALPYVETSCRMVVYLDGYLSPKHSYLSNTLSKFQKLADRVEESKWGLAQVQQPYFNGLTMTEIFEKTILDKGKDTSEHANTTLAWLQKQDDYQDIMTYYLNKYLAYDPNNPKYRELSSWFWEQYTTYGGSWRDQPLWAYTMHHFGAKPVVMTHDKHITRGGDLFVTGGTIGWDQHVHVPN